MDHSKVLTRLDQDRRTLWTCAYQIDIGPHVTRAWSNDQSHHWIIFTTLSAENADAIIEQQIEHYQRLGKSCEWKLYAHDTPADLRSRLETHGFRIGICEAVMVFDLNDAAAWIEQSDASSVARIDRLEQIADYKHVAGEVFGKDHEFVAHELAEALAKGSTETRGYIGYVDGQPASIGRMYTHPQSAFAGLYGGGTLERFRGRGLYRTLVAARARDALASGAKYLLVDALPTSRPILQRMGFEKVTETWPCQWEPA